MREVGSLIVKNVKAVNHVELPRQTVNDQKLWEDFQYTKEAKSSIEQGKGPES